MLEQEMLGKMLNKDMIMATPQMILSPLKYFAMSFTLISMTWI